VKEKVHWKRWDSKKKGGELGEEKRKKGEITHGLTRKGKVYPRSDKTARKWQPRLTGKDPRKKKKISRKRVKKCRGEKQVLKGDEGAAGKLLSLIPVEKVEEGHVRGTIYNCLLVILGRGGRPPGPSAVVSPPSFLWVVLL